MGPSAPPLGVLRGWIGAREFQADRPTLGSQPRPHRIHLKDLADEEAQATLRAIWNDPLSLDPARRSAKVTREIAAELAELAETLEGSGRDADTVASFLMRCLFTMFAEDVGLLPKRSFFDLLEDARKNPQQFQPLVTGLWKTMDRGGFSPELRSDLLRFKASPWIWCAARGRCMRACRWARLWWLRLGWTQIKELAIPG